tara:strand:- start:5 stop:454 length:450 start_codon:yes stop_codon:yes gene_type:complete
MFKQLNVCKFEALGATGGWNSIGYFEKLQESMKGAYVDKVRISFILEGDAAGQTNEAKGYLWATSNKQTLSGTDALNSDYIISGSASGNTGGGVVTLPIKRLIEVNSTEENSSQGRIWVHVRGTDTGSENANLTMIVESWGRWHTFVPQ